jgi:hypothetical protein
MRAFLVSIIALAATVCAGGLSSEANASTWLAMFVTGDQADRPSDLIVMVKKKKKHDDGGSDEKQDDGGKKQDDSSGQSQNGAADDASELTNCTIQSGGGGGCKTGFKYLCETLKNGKKCCGCVVDKNAKPEIKPGSAQPQALAVFACESDVETTDGRIIPNRKAGIKAANDTEARIIYMTSLPQGVPLRGPVTCTLNPGQ